MLEKILEQIYPITEHNVIIADGEFPQNDYLQNKIRQAQTIICCDGAIYQLLKHQIMPHYIIGDCDSLDKEQQLDLHLHTKIIKVLDQNSNDLTKAINLAKELNLNNLIVLGATGLREDHTIANIALLPQYNTLIEHIAFISDYGIFTTHKDKVVLKTVPGQQISFFCPNPNTLVSCKELKWPLDKINFALWYQGTLNQATNSQIHLITTNDIIVFRAFEIKDNNG